MPLILSLQNAELYHSHPTEIFKNSPNLLHFPWSAVPRNTTRLCVNERSGLEEIEGQKGFSHTHKNANCSIFIFTT